LRLYEVIWKERFIEKIKSKHNITTDEVEQVLFSDKAHFRRAQKGRIKGEDLYAAYGQTEMGRYMIVFFIDKNRRNAALPISARDMSKTERRYYAQKR